MALNIAKEVRAMQKRSVRELRQQYADVFGEATNRRRVIARRTKILCLHTHHSLKSKCENHERYN